MVHSLVFSNFWHFKNDEKCFLFHVKSLFRSLDIYVSVLTFRRAEKQLNEKVKVNFKIYDVTN